MPAETPTRTEKLTIQKISRRSALKTAGSLGIGIATGSIIASTAAADNKPFNDQLKTVRDTTKKYEDIFTAEDNGYGFVDIRKSVGVIFFNSDNIGNTGHSEDPSVFFYAPEEGSDLTTEDGRNAVENDNTELAGIDTTFVAGTARAGYFRR